MNFHKKYEFAGRVFLLKSQSEIADSRFFDNFRAKPFSVPDYVITVKQEELPFTENEPVHRHGDYFIGEINGKRLVYSSFPASYGRVEYACLDFDFESKSGILITNYDQLWDSMIISAIDVSDILYSDNMFVLHSSFISYNGEGVLFSGKSGIGKSTQANLWEKYAGAEIINGDRSVIEFRDGKLFAHGIPFCGSSNIALKKTLPVKKIVFLNQSTKNEISVPMRFNLIMCLMSQIGIGPIASLNMNKLLDKMLSLVGPDYLCSFSCRKDESAVETLKQHLFC